MLLGLASHNQIKQNKDLSRIHETVKVVWIKRILIFYCLGLGPLGKPRLSKPFARGAAIIGLLEFFLGISLIVGGILLQERDVNDDINASNDPKYYGLWSGPGVSLYLHLWVHSYRLV